MKATYYFDDGHGTLQAVPCTADPHGNLTRPGDPAPFCTGATATAAPTSGHYVIEEPAGTTTPDPESNNNPEEPESTTTAPTLNGKKKAS